MSSNTTENRSQKDSLDSPRVEILTPQQSRDFVEKAALRKERRRQDDLEFLRKAAV